MFKTNSRMMVCICLVIVVAIASGGCFMRATEPSTTGTVKGKIVNDSGEPIGGIMVTVAGKSTETDAEGWYSISGLEPGGYTISVSSERFKLKSELPGIVVEVGKVATVADIVMEPTYGFVVNMETGGVTAFYGAEDLLREAGLIVWTSAGTYRQPVGQEVAISEVEELGQNKWKLTGTFASADLTVEVDLTTERKAVISYTLANNTDGKLWNTLAVGGVLSREIYEGATATVDGFYNGEQGVPFVLDPDKKDGGALFSGGNLWARGYTITKSVNSPYNLYFYRTAQYSGTIACYAEGYLSYINISTGLNAGEVKSDTLTIVLGSELE